MRSGQDHPLLPPLLTQGSGLPPGDAGLESAGHVGYERDAHTPGFRQAQLMVFLAATVQQTFIVPPDVGLATGSQRQGTCDSRT